MHGETIKLQRRSFVTFNLNKSYKAVFPNLIH